VLPADKPGSGNSPEKAPEKAPDLKTYTPQGAAAEALKAIDPSTVVTVDRTARVAGQPAYTLVLTPRDSRSTVRRVLISIDAKHSVPLRVQVYGAAAAPAFETAFTDITFKRPAASVFSFTPPKGSKVSKDLLPLMAQPSVGAPDGTSPDSSASAPEASPAVVGSGWTSVLVLPATADGSSPLAGLAGGRRSGEDSTSSMIQQLTSTLPNGDRVLRSALVNVLLTRDGRVLVGAVSTSVLEQAAAGHLG
jgi:hypothetical protein